MPVPTLGAGFLQKGDKEMSEFLEEHGEIVVLLVLGLGIVAGFLGIIALI